MITKKDYIEYLISTPVNYTHSNLVVHLDEVSHDAVRVFAFILRFASKYEIDPL